MKNLEIKAVYADLTKAEYIALSIDAKKRWKHEQRDTYFKVQKGKLKLRQVNGEPAELIFYERPPIKEIKISNYCIFQSLNSDELSSILSNFIDIEIVVSKIRTLYLWHNVRIHLDQVENLGTFIEFEAVLDSDENMNSSPDRLQFLMNRFLIIQNDLISKGYYELLRDNLKNNRE